MLPTDTAGTANLGDLYCFSDSATSSMPSTDSPIYLQDAAVIPGGDYKPVDALSAFDGKPLGGVWTLDVNDTRPSEDGGAINGFSISNTNCGFGRECHFKGGLREGLLHADCGVCAAYGWWVLSGLSSAATQHVPYSNPT